METLEPASPGFESSLGIFLEELGPRLDTGSRFLREYMQAYFKNSHFTDQRALFRGQDEAGALIITVEKSPNQPVKLSNWGLPISYLGSAHPSVKKPLATYFRNLIEHHQVDKFHYRDTVEGGIISPLTEIIYTLEGTLKITPGFTSNVDLTRSEAELWSATRKSFRSLINWGKKNLTIAIHTGTTATAETIHICRSLHREAAGRATRSAESWQVQCDLAQEEKAFYLIASLDDAPVAFVFISLEQNCALYSCAAAKRDLFDKPLNHVLIWQAIIESRKRQIPLFHLGESMFATPAEVDQKERNIALFKRGFCTETKPHLDLHWQANPD